MTHQPLDLTDYPEINMPPRTLLGPGPSMVDPRVLKAMATPLVGHLDPEFIKLMNRTQDLLRYVFETENELTLPVSGTGTAAMETAVVPIRVTRRRTSISINTNTNTRISFNTRSRKSRIKNTSISTNTCTDTGRPLNKARGNI